MQFDLKAVIITLNCERKLSKIHIKILKIMCDDISDKNRIVQFVNFKMITLVLILLFNNLYPDAV